ncbi:unnamed protein product [Didymodactylos carnosus]|uniref:Glycosyl hydrolase family 13 catalytic domain-containing protein n=1 Tax=Didymodactylos carnosus TaxID=1234261 RepID=A0A815IIX1_9BILA|nr:unnamed protein product [Didymodactylos carnosus]CAF1366498.1 unnamed protein product [Didymodactylos carnosus]CAF3982576.1 unnamed protein product [Didymodactylos carnosus]CAF4249177.1 unnamed protein product [Didymodactylos carnosus]
MNFHRPFFSKTSNSRVSSKILDTNEQLNEGIYRCKHGVSYQIFVQSFYDSNGDGIGDLNGIRLKLDYLKGLGISLIWLMPIHPSKSYHKYDVVDHFSIHPDYGTLDDFKQLIREAHERNILIIIDLVVNHTSCDHPWFVDCRNNRSSQYRDFYIWQDSEKIQKLGHKRLATPDSGLTGVWHPVVEQNENENKPPTNTISELVIAAVQDNISKFSSQIPTAPPLPSSTEIKNNKKAKNNQNNNYYAMFDPSMPDLNYDNENVKRAVIDIGKYWLKFGVDGFRLDAAKHIYKPHRPKDNHNWWQLFRSEMEKINSNVYLVGEVWDMAYVIAPYLRGIPSMFNFEMALYIMNCVHRERCQGLLNRHLENIEFYTATNPEYLDALFLTNHDQTRLMTEMNKNKQKAKMCASILLTLSGSPFIYYGEEIGMLGDKPDENIREPFYWTDKSDNTGQTTWLKCTYTTRSNGCVPFDEQINDSYSLYSHYKTLIHIRNQSDALTFGDLIPIDVKNASICAFERIYGQDTVLVIHNLSTKSVTIPLPNNISENDVTVLWTTNNQNQLGKKNVTVSGYSTIILKPNIAN